MKKTILILGAALALVACDKNQGGAGSTGEYPQTGSGSSAATNAPAVNPSNPADTNNASGAALSPGGNSSGAANGDTVDTNSSSRTR